MTDETLITLGRVLARFLSFADDEGGYWCVSPDGQSLTLDGKVALEADQARAVLSVEPDPG